MGIYPAAMTGSSPLTRGALVRGLNVYGAAGLIPAHAGSTVSGVTKSAAMSAHPRSRGEHTPGIVTAVSLWGSSPLTRGARIRNAVLGLHQRLIPAHAGSTSRWSSRSAPARAHPRSRGEHANSGPRGSPESGSSPLTRGAPMYALMVGPRQGLIPAHAGSTRRRRPYR